MAVSQAAPQGGAKSSNISGAVVIDLGKKKKKAVKQLRKGRGKLMARVTEAIAELQSAGSLDSNAKPVIVIVEKRANESFF